MNDGWQYLSVTFTPPADQSSPLYIRIVTTAGRTRGLRFLLPTILDAERLAYWRLGMSLTQVQWPVPTNQVSRSIPVHAVVPFPIRGVPEQLQSSLELKLADRAVQDVIVMPDCQVKPHAC
jgi:hypothetical protein